MTKQKPKIKEQQLNYDSEIRYEIIDGVRYEFQAAPGISHQQIITYFLTKMDDTCTPAGLVLTSPIDVKFDDENEFQPDVVYISNDNMHIVTEKKIIGAPDIIVEVLSPSTSDNDKIRKKAVYERFGVKEYWIVDPVHLFVDQFVLNNNKYVLQQTYGKGDTIHSELFSCINIELKPIFDRLLVFDKD